LKLPYGKMLTLYVWADKGTPEGTKFLAAWDTGAEHNLIKDRVFWQMVPFIQEDPNAKIVLFENPVQMFGVSGRPLTVKGAVIKCPLRIKHYLIRADFMIVSQIAKDVIFGRPFLRDYRVNLQEGDDPQIRFKIPKKDFIAGLIPAELTRRPEFAAAPDDRGIPVKFTTTNGLYASWYHTSRSCTVATPKDLQQALKGWNPTEVPPPPPRTGPAGDRTRAV
jgi:hypothetical protein